MSLTKLRQAAQIGNSLSYDDALTPGSSWENAGTNVELDLNALRTQVKRILYVAESGNWYDDIPTVGSNKRGLQQIGTDLNQAQTDIDTLEAKKLLFRAQVLTDITVTAAQNWEVLSVASSEAPSETAAVGAGTANGAIVALLAADVGSHSLNEVAGVNALNPKNLVVVRDATTGDYILSSGKQIYGLIQAESTVLDGDTFNDTTKQVQISFVRENATADDLEACPVADIATKSINYSYVRRLNFSSVPEQSFLSGAFVDQSAAVDVTLDAAVAGQVGVVDQTSKDIDWQITDAYKFRFQTTTGDNLVAVLPGVGGDEVEFNVTTFDVNNSAAADFNKGITVDSADTGINLGVTAGQIDRAGALTVTATGSGNDLTLSAADQVILSDGNKAGSSYASAFALSAASQDWSDLETAVGGEYSLVKSIALASGKTTLDQAIDNQGVTPASQTLDTYWRITDAKALSFQTSDGGVNILSILPAVAGDEVELNVTTFDVNNSAAADFNKGLTVDSADTGINLGVTAGQVDRAGALTVTTTGAGNDLTLSAADQVILSDGYYAGSTYDTPLVLSDSSAEWSAFDTAFGEVSLLNAIVAASSKTTLDQAVDNQIAAATDVTQADSLDWRVTDAKTFKFQTSDGGVDLLSIAPASGGDVVAVNCDTFDVNAVNSVDFYNGITAHTAGVGTVVVTGTSIAAQAGDLQCYGDSITFNNSYRAGSTWSLAAGIPLALSSAEWSAYETAVGGELSLLAGIAQARNVSMRTKVEAVVTAATISANDNVTGSGGSPNVDAVLPSYHGLTFVSALNIYVNGQLMRCGADASANFDTYPGTTDTTGDLKFEFDLKQGDRITVEVFGKAS